MNATLERHSLETMTHEQCQLMMRKHRFGRLAFIEHPERVRIAPVKFTSNGNAVVMRTAAGAKLTYGPFTWLALEIDDVADDESWGWSVVATGYALDISKAIDDWEIDLRELASLPIGLGDHDRYMAIKIRDFTGRYFGNPANCFNGSKNAEVTVEHGRFI